MEKWVDDLFALIFSLLPFGKEGVKDFLFGHGLGPMWTVARDYVFNYRVWLLGVAPCVLLERWRPAVRGNQARRASLRLDLLYPVGKFLLLPVTAAWVGVITTVYHRTFPFLDTGLLDGQPLAVQMIGAFLIGDLAFYVSHRLRHSVQWFWYFHVIHHSQENLNPMTTYRTHFFDGAIETLIRTFPMALVGGRPVAWTLFIVLNNFWSYFLHANVRTNLGPLRYILASPQFHRVHHSVEPQHFDRNFGEHIVVWDWLFGTMVKDFACYPPTGVAGIERWMIETDGAWTALPSLWLKQSLYPFYKIAVSGAVQKVEDHLEAAGGRIDLLHGTQEPRQLDLAGQMQQSGVAVVAPRVRSASVE